MPVRLLPIVAVIRLVLEVVPTDVGLFSVEKGTLIQLEGMRLRRGRWMKKIGRSHQLSLFSSCWPPP